MSTLAYSQEYYDGKSGYEKALKNVNDNLSPDKDPGPGYWGDLETAISKWKAAGASDADVSQGQSLLNNR